MHQVAIDAVLADKLAELVISQPRPNTSWGGV